MATPKKYFHDRFVLLLLSINAFLAIAGSMLILLRVETDSASIYAVQYRSRLGLDAFTSGTAGEIISFAVFSVLIFAFHALLSKKAFPIKRHFALVVLGMGTLLLVLSIVISNALLVY